jgi:hypothetical protein
MSVAFNMGEDGSSDKSGTHVVVTEGTVTVDKDAMGNGDEDDDDDDSDAAAAAPAVADDGADAADDGGLLMATDDGGLLMATDEGGPRLPAMDSSSRALGVFCRRPVMRSVDTGAPVPVWTTPGSLSTGSGWQTLPPIRSDEEDNDTLSGGATWTHDTSSSSSHVSCERRGYSEQRLTQDTHTSRRKELGPSTVRDMYRLARAGSHPQLDRRSLGQLR